MQMALQLKLRAADGKPVEHTVYHTINRLPIQRIDPAPDPRIVRPGQLDDQTVARLKPGLIATFRQRDGKGERTDVRSSPPRGSFGTKQSTGNAQAAARRLRTSCMGICTCPSRMSAHFSMRETASWSCKSTATPVPVARRRSAAENVVPIVLRKGYNQIGMRISLPRQAMHGFACFGRPSSLCGNRFLPRFCSMTLATSNSRQQTRGGTGESCLPRTAVRAAISWATLPWKTSRCRRSRGGPSLDKIGDRLSTAWIAAWIEAQGFPLRFDDAAIVARRQPSAASRRPGGVFNVDLPAQPIDGRNDGRYRR